MTPLPLRKASPDLASALLALSRKSFKELLALRPAPALHNTENPIFWRESGCKSNNLFTMPQTFSDFFFIRQTFFIRILDLGQNLKKKKGQVSWGSVTFCAGSGIYGH